MPIPPELLNQIAVALEVVVACVTALAIAFWIGMVIWTFRDIRARTRDIFAWLLATLLVLVTGPVGLLLYLLLRPRETLAQAYDRQLEEEALLRDITARRACPSCQAVTEPDWLICPHCRTELRRTCQACGRPLELDWTACPYCAAPLEKPKASRRRGRKPAIAAVSLEPAAVPEEAAPPLAPEPEAAPAGDGEPQEAFAAAWEPASALPAEAARE